MPIFAITTVKIQGFAVMVEILIQRHGRVKIMYFDGLRIRGKLLSVGSGLVLYPSPRSIYKKY